MKTEIFDSIQKYEDFYNELDQESPRGAVIISVAYFDKQLQELLKSHFEKNISTINEIFNCRESLRSFYAKLELANKLNLIENDIYKDLGIINEIRNIFAHQIFDTSFENEKIIEKCNKLRNLIPSDNISNTPENNFKIASALIMQRLAMKLLKSKDI